MTHYELFFLYGAGFKPRQIMQTYGYSETTVYRAHRNYRKAQKLIRLVIKAGHSPPFKREKKVNTPDH